MTATYAYAGTLTVETCCHEGCGIVFGLDWDHYHRLRNDSSQWFYCPNGHRQHYTGKTDAAKLRDAEAREVALRDQLEAANVEQERITQILIRDRIRFRNGVCPCCSRSFENVRRHMATKHPEYDASQVVQPVQIKCSCGRTFETLRGLRTHQGHMRDDNWAKPGRSKYWAHLTVGAGR